MPSLVRYRKHVIDPDGLEYVAAVGGEGLEPGGDRVLDVAGQALDVHREPVRIVVGHLELIFSSVKVQNNRHKHQSLYELYTEI